MANEDLRVRITAQIQGLDAVESLKNAVRQLQNAATPAAADLTKLKNAAMQLGSATDRTESDLRRSINALKDVRSQLSITGTEYKKLTKTIDEYQKALDKATNTQRGGGGGSRTGQAIGAIASGAIFGGPEGGLGGLLGAGIGAATGGGAVAGAFAGAAVGATAGMFRQQITGASDYAGELARLRIALKGVSTDQAEFNKSLNFIEKTAPQFLMSVGDATKNYTKLQASVRGAGMGVDETQKVFQGLSAAIVATGGGTEQLNGAMLAATQVFSKGKVSAEELRGQIGERLPGAFTLFAQAVKMTPQQLDKALEQGKISTADFVKFTEELYKRYGASAKAIGESPFAASVRFQIAMDNMRAAAGNALLPIISFFQNLGTDALNSLTRVFEGTTQWQKALGGAFSAVSKLIGGVAGLNQILGALIKTTIVLAGVQAGMFVVSNLNAFSNGLKSIIGLTRTLLELSKSLLKIETARAAINAILTGVTTGASRGKIAGAVIGGGLGIAAIAGLGKGIDALIENITGTIDKATKMPELGGTFGGENPPLPQSTELSKDEQQLAKDRFDLEKKLADFRQQSLEKAQALERDLADQRLKLERQISDNRLKLQQQYQDIELERSKRAAQAAGLDTGVFDLQQGLNEVWRKFDQERFQADRQYTDKKKELELRIEDYKLSVAKGIAEILEDAADKVAKRMIEGATGAASVLSGGTASLSTATGRRAIPGSVGKGQLGIENLVSLARSAGFRGQDAAIMAAIAMAESGGRATAHNKKYPDNSYGLWQINMLGGMGPERRRQFGIGSNEALFDPAVNANAARMVHQSQGFGAWSVYRSGAYKQYLPQAMSAATNGSARTLIGRPVTAAVTPNMANIEAERGKITGLLGTNRDLEKQGSFGEVLKDTEQRFTKITSELDAQGKSVTEQLRDYEALSSLISSGLSPEMAALRLEAEKKATVEYNYLQTLRAQLVDGSKRKDLSAAERAELDLQVQAIDERISKQPQIIAAQQAQLQQLEEMRKRQEAMKELTTSIGGSLSQGIIGGIDAAIEAAMTGAKNLNEQLKQIAAGVLKDIGRALIRFGLNSLAGGLGLGNFFKFADGGVMTNVGPLPLKRYAGGGVANSPQMALFGERGPEAYVPLPDGRSIPVKMQQRDEALARYRPVPGSTEAAAAGGDPMATAGGAGGASVIDVRYQSQVINNVEYVTAEEFQKGIRQAAVQGATQGERKALRSLQQSTTVRRRVGLR